MIRTQGVMSKKRKGRVRLYTRAGDERSVIAKFVEALLVPGAAQTNTHSRDGQPTAKISRVC
jgi:hypothetical protein